LLTDVRKGDINGLLKVAYVYDEEAKRCNRKSLEWALLAAIKECPEAQLKVASMLHSGPPGIKEDYNLAMEWYLQAAKNGNVDALNSIECMYKHSLIDLQHSITAKERFLKASKHGASSSVHKIGGDQEHGVARETPINIKRLSANLHGFQQGNVDTKKDELSTILITNFNNCR
jgi:TPR repeat protein